MGRVGKNGAGSAKKGVKGAKNRSPVEIARSTCVRGESSAARERSCTSKKTLSWSRGRTKPALQEETNRSPSTGFLSKPLSPVAMCINGEWREFDRERDLSPSMTLAYLLREKLGLTGLKVACEEGACGACTVIMDGKAVLSCLVLALEADGHDIQTIEGLSKDDPVVEAFAEQSEPGFGTALQCGYCTPGFVMTARALLNENPMPNLQEVKEALSGNICRCGCYAAIAQAVLHASEKIRARGGLP